MAAVIHCSIRLEVNGRAVHGNKRTQQGVEFAASCLRFLGFTGTFEITAAELKKKPSPIQIHDGKKAEGSLALRYQQGPRRMQVWLSQVPEFGMSQILDFLHGRMNHSSAECHSASTAHIQEGTAGLPLSGDLCFAAGSNKLSRRVATPQTQHQRHCSATSHIIILVAEGQHLWDEVAKFWDARCYAQCHVVLRQACRGLSQLETLRPMRMSFHPGKASAVPIQELVAAVQRHRHLEELCMSGFSSLSCLAAKALSEAIKCNGSSLKVLELRGCKALSDAALHGLLTVCKRLEVLDLLEIPGLGNRCFAAGLPNLRRLAAGSLGPARIDSGARRKHPAAMKFTSSLLPQLCGQQSHGHRGLTHLILCHCAEIETLCDLPPSVQHVDLRGSSLSIQKVTGWAPLRMCHSLTSISLAGCTLLSAEAITACLASLPTASHLRAVDVSETSANESVFALLAKHAHLTHVRLGHLSAINGFHVANLLRCMPELVALDVFPWEPCRAVDSDEVWDEIIRAKVERPSLKWLAIGQSMLGPNSTLVRKLCTFARNAAVVYNPLDLWMKYQDSNRRCFDVRCL